MIFLPYYKETLNCSNKDKVFDYLINTLKPSNLTWSYFVNWEKVISNTKRIEVALNCLNYLIGKSDFDNEFKTLIKENPNVVKALPFLLVRRGSETMKFKILVDYKSKKLTYEDYDFSIDNPSEEDIEQYLEFIDKTGFKKLILNRNIKNLADYMLGVEAGLDSNARKNRGGSIMETIVEVFIQDICKKRNYRYLREADAKKIKKEFGLDVPFDKSSRRYDFVINANETLYIFETNYYAGGGSKLKSTASEYKNLHNVLKDKYIFIWITDGKGWEKTKRPLRETFEHIDYLFNLNMLEHNILDNIVK